jgi:hypothetical protein
LGAWLQWLRLPALWAVGSCLVYFGFMFLPCLRFAGTKALLNHVKQV